MMFANIKAAGSEVVSDGFANSTENTLETLV
jgi:hypothetical protein